MSSSTCTPHHDWFTAALTFGLCSGLIISYAPQHFRIINKGSSEGFSPWFLSSWGIVRCCRVVSLGRCVEMSAGIVQVGLQWLLFTVVFVLYMVYYPPHLKYILAPAQPQAESQPLLPPKHAPPQQWSSAWRLSILLAWVTAMHFAFVLLTTITFLLSAAPSPTPYPSPTILAWAPFSGIPMMCIQSPGAVLMVLSIALRPGTNWTSWITFAVAGLMQGSLLVMCILWKYRQRRLAIDDFGMPLSPSSPSEPVRSRLVDLDEEALRDVDPVPGLVADDTDPRLATRVLEVALESAVATSVWDSSTELGAEVDAGVEGEDAPLLGSSTQKEQQQGKWGWLWWGQEKR
ncbi:hypothetical protein BD779DRAFT_1547907 [Infundibulicybe gibba]|nr:hypothetical protein BD779DRAFT_1547907 [Infundibulicybe gibba]